MIVGSNERRYAWMDEGLNTYINAFAKELRWRDTRDDRKHAGKLEVDSQCRERRSADDSCRQRSRSGSGSRRLTANRPWCCSLCAITSSAASFSILPSANTSAIGRSSIRRPAISSERIENAAGRDLSWFWREFWYTTDLLDIAIDSVSQRQQGAQSLATVSLHRRTAVLLPGTTSPQIREWCDCATSACRSTYGQTAIGSMRRSLFRPGRRRAVWPDQSCRIGIMTTTRGEMRLRADASGPVTRR